MIVDDHPLMRQGLAMTLEAERDIEVTWQASSAEEALDLMDKEKPDVAIVDISLPGMGGLELIKHWRARDADAKLLVVSRHDESLYAERAIRAGARGYVMKLEAADVIVTAVRRVAAGGIFVSPEINDRLLNNLAAGRSTLSDSPMDLLSDRELEVFELTGGGLSTREISDRLHLSIKTVESYRSRIKDKLNLSSATELLQHAVHWVGGEGRSEENQ